MEKIIGNFDSSESSNTTEDDGEPGPRFTLEPVATLPFLPDDCLLAVMRYLGPVDLNSLSRISDRIKFLVADKSLWKRIDFRPYRLLSSQLKEYLKYFNSTTTFVALQGFVSEPIGNHWRRRVITPRLLNAISIKCPTLETLILDAIAFELNLANFPASLRHLSMRNCVVTGLHPGLTYFQGMHTILPNIKVLILSNCGWVSPHDFMAISKCSLLEELRMDGCPQLGECVAYTSLAARFGFPSLKILDLRNTRMGDSDVSCFSRTLSLTQLYLQSPSSDSEECDGRCYEPSCTDVPFQGDYIESSDEDGDEMDISAVTPPSNSCNRIWFPPTVFHMNSSPLSSKQPKKTRHDCRREDVSSLLRNENARGVENGDQDLPQASTSHGTLHILMNPTGPSAVQIGQKHGRARKRPSGDSGSSSDDSSSTSHHNVINTGASDTETIDSSNWSVDGSSRGKKYVYSKKFGHIITKPKRPCSGSDSIHSSNNNNNVIPFHVAAQPSNFAVAGCSTSSQRIDNLPASNPVIIISSRGISSSEGNSENGNDSQIVFESIPTNDSPPQNDQCDHSPANHRFNPHFFRLPPHEPSNESTITDLCIMSFILDDNEADRVGYVRIMSHQSVNARSQLRTLVIRNYKTITDAALQHLLKLSSLRYLDVSGTSVTEGGVLEFKLKRPDVFVLSDFENLPL